MLSEPAQWITPAIVILGFLFTARTIRNQRVDMESRMNRMDVSDGSDGDSLEWEDRTVWSLV